MIYWDQIQYSPTKAKEDFNKIEILHNKISPIELTPDLMELRIAILKARDDLYDEYNFDTANELKYDFDLLFGMKLFNLLNSNIGFTNRVASNDNVWRYLSVKVVPDIVHARWGLKDDHFYQMPRRIWLKVIYWYINLSWASSEEKTLEILKNNSTDTIQNLVERPGLGYNLELYREIMLQYFKQKHNVELFRTVMKLNTARLVVTTPQLSEGGVVGYVQDLFETAEV